MKAAPTWEPIAAIPEEWKDGRAVWVKRVHNGRLVSEGWASFGGWNPAADYAQPEPGIGWTAEQALAERRWMRPDHMHAFPEPTHFARDAP